LDNISDLPLVETSTRSASFPFRPFFETSLRLVVASRLAILGYERAASGRPESMHEQCSEGRSWIPDCPCASLRVDCHSAIGVHSIAAIHFGGESSPSTVGKVTVVYWLAYFGHFFKLAASVSVDGHSEIGWHSTTAFFRDDNSVL